MKINFLDTTVTEEHQIDVHYHVKIKSPDNLVIINSLHTTMYPRNGYGFTLWLIGQS